MSLEQFSAVSSTALVTLFARAQACEAAQPILDDPVGRMLAERLRPYLANRDDALSKMLLNDELPAMLATLLALRARHYDDAARTFLEQYPSGTIVNLGGGLDTRFYRLGAGSHLFYDVDLDPVTRLKRGLLEPEAGYELLASSVLDFGWMNCLEQYPGGQHLFLAEGLLMYLKEEEVRSLVLELQRVFPGCQLVAEVFNSRWLDGWRGRAVHYRINRRLNFGPEATFQSGLSDSDEMEGWGPGIHLLSDWSYFDDDVPQLGVLRYFSNWRTVRKMQWTVNYRLD